MATPLTDAHMELFNGSGRYGVGVRIEDWLPAVDAEFARRLEESHARLLALAEIPTTHAQQCVCARCEERRVAIAAAKELVK